MKPKLLRESGDPNWRSNAISYLNSQDEFPIRIFAYSLMLDGNDIGTAQSWLTNLVKDTEEKTDFATIQNIHLAYLANPDHYILTAGNIVALEKLAYKNISLNGFAQSVYQKITGLEMPITIDYGNGNTEIRSKKSDDMEITIYPNPVREDLVTIRLNNYMDGALLEVYDITGRLEIKSTISGNSMDISTNQFSKGIYIVKITTPIGESFTSKFIKQ